MGSSTEAIVVPFKISLFQNYPGTGLERLPPEFAEFLSGEDEDMKLSINGWECENIETFEKFKYSGSIVYTTPFQKGEYKVHYVNEDQYSNVGEVDPCFFSKDRESLETFCGDFGIDLEEIKETQAVIQTL